MLVKGGPGAHLDLISDQWHILRQISFVICKQNLEVHIFALIDINTLRPRQDELHFVYNTFLEWKIGNCCMMNEWLSQFLSQDSVSSAKPWLAPSHYLKKMLIYKFVTFFKSVAILNGHTSGGQAQKHSFHDEVQGPGH